MKKKELGDFQTPEILADLIALLLRKKNINPDLIIEPTCGLGSVLVAVHKSLQPRKSLGIDIQQHYIDNLRSKSSENIVLLNEDYFNSISFIKQFIGDEENILFVGNPPWVTNSELSVLNSSNKPKKNNTDKIRGIDAITGKSNFDISEYIIRELIDVFSNRKSVYAFLCKISVAKKIMSYIWKNKILYNCAELYPIDSKKYFSVSVDACLFYLDCSSKKSNIGLEIFESIDKQYIKYTSGFYKNVYFEDMSKKSVIDIYGKSPFVWRNGIKHDCAKVVELSFEDGMLKNGYDEILDIEHDLVYPYMKSSDLMKEGIKTNKRILITQKYLNESTEYIKIKYPKTWQYLTEHICDFDKRKSIIYKNKCKYSIFSVGVYTFKPFKIAISGLYKSLNFKLITPFENKVVLLDDTCNYISFDNMSEASLVFRLLKSELAIEYLHSRISWEAKRPVKTEILNSIDIEELAAKTGMNNEYNRLFKNSTKEYLLFG